MYITMKIELNETDEVLEREVKKFGNTSHVILPKKHLGKKAKVICSNNKLNSEEIQNEEEDRKNK